MGAVPKLHKFPMQLGTPAYPQATGNIAAKPKLTSAVRTRYRLDRSVRAGEVSRQVGAVDATDKPRDVPNAIKTSEKAEATSAPAITGVQCTKSVRTTIGAVAMRSEVCTAVFLSCPDRQRRPKNERMNRITTIKPIR